MLEGTQIAQAAVPLVRKMDAPVHVVMAHAAPLVRKMAVQVVRRHAVRVAAPVTVARRPVMQIVVQAVRHHAAKVAVQAMAVRGHAMQMAVRVAHHRVVRAVVQVMVAQHRAMRTVVRAATAHAAAAVRRDVKERVQSTAIRPVVDSVLWDAMPPVSEQQWPHKKFPTEISAGNFCITELLYPIPGNAFCCPTLGCQLVMFGEVRCVVVVTGFFVVLAVDWNALICIRIIGNAFDLPACFGEVCHLCLIHGVEVVTGLLVRVIKPIYRGSRLCRRLPGSTGRGFVNPTGLLYIGSLSSRCCVEMFSGGWMAEAVHGKCF